MVVSLFIPGVNLLVIGAIALTLVALAGHGLRAASGEGSWVDVAFDVFALATFGVGGYLGRGAKAAQGVSRAAGGRAASRVAQSQALASSSAQRTAAGQVLSSRTASSGARQAARTEITALKTAARRTGAAERRAFLQAPLPRANPAQRLLLGGGEDDVARALLDARSTAVRFGSNAAAVTAAAQAAAAANRARAMYGAGFLVDVGLDKSGLTQPAKDSPRFRREVGSTW